MQVLEVARGVAISGTLKRCTDIGGPTEQVRQAPQCEKPTPVRLKAQGPSRLATQLAELESLERRRRLGAHQRGGQSSSEGLAQPRATDHSDRHGVIRGIQRGTAARNASYSLPNVCSSVGSSYATTKMWKKSQSSAP